MTLTQLKLKAIRSKYEYEVHLHLNKLSIDNSLFKSSSNID